jgi:hypothetical protein
MATTNLLAAAVNASPAGTVVHAVESVASAVGIHTGSPRYNGGPLVTTVNGALQSIAAGGSGARAALDRYNPYVALASDPNHRQWLDVWNTEIPKVLPDAATASYYVQLDPSGAGRLPAQLRGAVNIAPAAASGGGGGGGGMSAARASWVRYAVYAAVVVALLVVGLKFLKRR